MRFSADLEKREHSHAPIRGMKRERERFPGAAALEDLASCVGDRPGASRVLARYAVARVTFRAIAGIAEGSALMRDLEIAREYADAITPAEDEDHERQTLWRVIELLRDIVVATPDGSNIRQTKIELVRALDEARQEAEHHRAPGGAHALELASRRVRV